MFVFVCVFACAEHLDKQSIRSIAVSGTSNLESAVSKPALATRNLHDISSTSSTQVTVNNPKMKKYRFKRTSPITVHATWSGDSLTMDNIIDHVQHSGHCEVADWVAFGRENKVILHFDSTEAAYALTQEASHQITAGSMKNTQVQFKMA
jgi:hypothetical protein